MKNKVYIFVIALILVLSSCGDSPKYTYFDNGKVRTELNYIGKSLNGISKYYYSTGILQSEYNYVDGKLDGRMAEYFYDGKLKEERYYKDGMQTAMAKSFFDNGAIGEIYSYKDNLKDGIYKSYYIEGGLRIEGEYLEGQIHGHWAYYDDYGRTVGDGEFDNGLGTLFKYYPSGKVQRSVDYRNSVKDGKELFFDELGNITDEIIFKEGVAI